MVDPREPPLQRTRVRSGATTKYSFEFVKPFEHVVFPILQRLAAGTSILAGTGFFITPDGLFMSAAHVFEIDVSEQDSFWAVYPDEDDQLIELEFEEVRVRPEKRDLAVGQARMQSIDHPVVSIMELDPEPNEVVGSCVFSQTLVHDAEETSDGLIQHMQFRNHWEIGLVEEVKPDGFWQTPGKAFSSSIFVEGRASGGPVFNSNGFVVGVNSRGFAPEDGLPYSVASSIIGIGDWEFKNATIRERRAEVPNRPIARLFRIK